MIAIIDYGMGNLRSVQKALETIGAKTSITNKADDIKNAAKVVLPGVGAMKPAMERLKELNLIEPIKLFIKSGKPFLGICLGYQLLFECSDEGGNTEGLNILAGSVKKFNQGKVPHMGWNQLNIKQKECILLKNVSENANTYFCHSYYVAPADDEDILTSTEYGFNFASSIAKGNIYGTQFHPEKSQSVGLTILKNFNEV